MGALVGIPGIRGRPAVPATPAVPVVQGSQATQEAQEAQEAQRDPGPVLPAARPVAPTVGRPVVLPAARPGSRRLRGRVGRVRRAVPERAR